MSGRVGNALLEVLGEGGLFTCSLCGGVFRTPVTVDCGHTFCVGCLPRGAERCVRCHGDLGLGRRSTNVLVQDLVGKYDEATCDNAMLEAVSILGIEPRYWLRSRFAGLLPKNTKGGNSLDTVLRLCAPTRTSRVTSKLGEQKENMDISCENRYEEVFNHMGVSLRESLNDEIQIKLMEIFREVFRIKDESQRNCWSNVTKTDLECILCSRCFSDPVTTSCGHTFCRDCLVRVLDYGLSCPLCVAPLNHSEVNRGTTRTLEEAIRTLFPEEYEERRLGRLEEVNILSKNSEIPVFICTNAFPGVACPLYVYEPRYRLMARRCLQSDTRMFAMASKLDTKSRFASFGTVLEIKDAVLMKNGQYILTTVGHRRFKVISKGEMDGYDTANIQYIRDITISAEQLPELIALHERVHLKAVKWVNSLTRQALAEAERLLGPMPSVEKDWMDLPDGPGWTWWLMPIMPLCKQLQVGFLSTVSLEKRLRAIDKMLEHFKVRMKALERNTPLNCTTDVVESSETCGGETDHTINMEYSH